MIGGQLVDRIVLGANGISFPNDTVGFASGTVAFFNNSAAPAGWTADTTLDGSNGILRVVSPDTWVEDQGGTADFASVFTAQTPAGSISSVTSTGTIAAHVLAQSEIPSHTHGVSGTTGTESADHVHNVQGSTGTESAAHSHAVPFSSGSAGSGNWSNTQSGTGADHTVQSGGESANHTHAFNVNSGGRSAAHTHSFSVTSAATGGGTGHTHGLTMAAHDHTFTGTEMSFDVKHHMVLRCVKN